MPVINASAGLGDSLVRGVSQGADAFRQQRNISTEQDQRQQRIDQMERALQMKEAEQTIRSEERKRILGETQQKIADTAGYLHKREVGRAGARGFAAGVERGFVNPLNPMTWGYAGKKIGQELDRMQEEIGAFEAIMSSLPPEDLKALGPRKMAEFEATLRQQQDQLKRYGASSQVNEWLVQHPEDAEAFTPIIEQVREGAITPESAFSQLEERRDEFATRQGQMRNADQFLAGAETMLTTLGIGVNPKAQAATLAARERILAGADPEAVWGAYLTDILPDGIKTSFYRAEGEDHGAKVRAKAGDKARASMEKGLPPPGYDGGKWSELDPMAQQDVWTQYHMGEGYGPGPFGSFPDDAPAPEEQDQMRARTRELHKAGKTPAQIRAAIEQEFRLKDGDRVPAEVQEAAPPGGYLEFSRKERAAGR